MRFLLVFCLAAAFLSFKPAHAQGPEYIVPLSVEITGTPAPGYIFLSPFNLDTAGQYAPGLMVLDSAASPLVYQPQVPETAPPFSVSFVADLNLQPNGELTYFFQYQDGKRVLRVLDENFALTDTVACGSALEHDAHEAIIETDGTTHIFCLEERIMDCSQLTTSMGAQGSDSTVVVGNNIQRLDANGNVLWEWPSLDYFALEDTYSEYYITPEMLDHTHVNSLEIDADGHYLMSSRHLNEITKINSTTGDIIWRFGGKQNDFTLLGDTVWFTGQHDARRLPNGNLTLFDNATQTPNAPARAIEYELDEVNMTATAVWQYALGSGHNSLFIGNTQRLENGHTLIDWGGARPFNETISIEEIDSADNTVLTIDFPGAFVSYRARKFELPFALPRPAIACNNNTLTSSTADEYYWSTGATTASIALTDTGSYHVWARNGETWFRSDVLTVADSAACATGIASTTTPSINWRAYPNPAHNTLRIEAATGGLENVQLSDVSGRVVWQLAGNQQPNQLLVDVSDIAPGMYLLSANGFTQRIIVR